MSVTAGAASSDQTRPSFEDDRDLLEGWTPTAASVKFRESLGAAPGEHVDYVVGGPDRHEAPIRIVSLETGKVLRAFSPIKATGNTKTIIKLNDVQAACPEGKENSSGNEGTPLARSLDVCNVEVTNAKVSLSLFSTASKKKIAVDRKSLDAAATPAPKEMEDGKYLYLFSTASKRKLLSIASR